MLVFLVSRALHALVVALVMAFLAFGLLNLLGDPVENMVGQEATRQDRQELRTALGLDDPVPVRFARFVGAAATGDLGISLQYKVPVRDLIRERLPATAELVLVAAGVSIGLGTLLGMTSALWPRSAATKFALAGSLVGVSLPTFATGTLLIFALAVVVPLFPAFGRGDTVELGWWTTGLLTESGLRSLILPGITLGFFQLAMVLRLVRAELGEVLRANFVRFARARGLGEASVVVVHALRSALLPVVTVAGMNLAGLVAYSVITETVFQWPGLGLLFVDAVQFADVPLLAAYLMLVAVLFALVNLGVDVLYSAIDPRIKVAGEVAR